MSDSKQKENKGYQPEQIEKGYQPQSDSPSDNERFGYQPPENSSSVPSSINNPPGEE